MKTQALPRFLPVMIIFECGHITHGVIAPDYADRLDFLFPHDEPFPCLECNPSGLQVRNITAAHLHGAAADHPADMTTSDSVTGDT